MSPQPLYLKHFTASTPRPYHQLGEGPAGGNGACFFFFRGLKSRALVEIGNDLAPRAATGTVLALVEAASRQVGNRVKRQELVAPQQHFHGWANRVDPNIHFREFDILHATTKSSRYDTRFGQAISVGVRHRCAELFGRRR